MVQAASTFRKSGFNDEDAATLAEVAATFQNVADTALGADDAAASIISQLRAYGKTAEWATHVVDAYNAVANTQAVGTNDLAAAMEVASAAMATYGNSFEQVLGLVTSGTEILQGRPAQVARGLNTIAGRIVSNQDALAEYGIIVQDVNGNLKSTYDVLAELKPKWVAMTDAQRVALGEALAGANQYKVLSSVLQNFDSAVTATTTAMNSANSAANENARYMESINARVQTLKATFQDFSRNVFNEEFIKRILDTANVLLEFVNTPFGQAATRITLLSTALFGFGGILKSYWKYFVQGSAIAKRIKALIDVSSLSGPSITGWEKFGAVLPKIGAGLKAIAPFAAVFTLLAAAIKAGTKKLDDYNAALEKTAEIQEKISDAQTEYDGLINKTGVLTEVEEKRLEVLKEILAAQEAALEAAKKEKWEKWNALHGTGAKTVVGGAEGIGGGLGTGAVETVTADVSALSTYKGELTKIERAYNNGKISAGEYYAQLQEVNKKYAESVEIIREAIDAGYDVSDQQRQLVSAYDEVQAKLGITNSKTESYVDGLIAEARQAGYTRESLYNLVAAQIQASKTGLNFTQQISALQQLGYQAGLTAQQVAAAVGSVGNPTQDARNRERTIRALMQNNGMSREQAEAKLYADTQRNLWNTISKSNPNAFSFPDVTVPGADTSAFDAKAAAENKRQAQIKSLEKERDAVQDVIDAINKKYDAQIEALEKVNDELEDEIELQQILEEMAKAKSTKKMVYKDGRFQYVDDLDAVATAQVKLDEYNRKKALKDQKEFIEKRRDIELAWYIEKSEILENEIKQLQNYNDTTSSIRQSAISDMESQASQAEAAAARIRAAQTLQTSPPPSSTSKPHGGGGGTYDVKSNNLLTTKPSKSASETAGNIFNQVTGGKSTYKPSTSLPSGGVYMRDSAAIKKRAAELLHSGKASSVSEAFRLAKAGYAKGTTRAAGGLSVVGEQGPELRVLNQGDGILPNQITKNLMAIGSNPQLFMQQPNGSCSTIVNVANVTLPDVKDASGFVSGLKNMALQKAYARH